MEDQETASSSSNLTFNPFEAESLDSLHLPTFSPSVFSTRVATPASQKKPGDFRWSIDQLASLYPADIDENVHQEEAQLDHETEAKVQNTISRFFEEQLHAPSPWSAHRPTGKLLNSKSPGHSLSRRYVCEDSPSIPRNVPVKPPPQDASVPTKGVDAICQTAVTLPVNFDLIALLGDKFPLYTEPAVQDQSSLRRKLFPLSDTSRSLTPNSGSSLMGSGSSPDQALPSPDVSPVVKDEEVSGKCQAKTPNSGGSQFSSSPLVVHSSLPRVCTPFTPRVRSPHLQDLGTPLLSPICKNSETPRTGNPDKRNQSVSFASKLSFTSDPSISSSPSTDLKPGRRKLSPHADLNTEPESMDNVPHFSEQKSFTQTSSANQVCPGCDDAPGGASRSDFTTSLFGDGEVNCENDKLTSTQLVEGNSGNDLTFDITMNEADLTAMETSSALACSGAARLQEVGSSCGASGTKPPSQRSDLHPRLPAEKLFVTNGMVENRERNYGGSMPTLGRTDSGYNTNSLPTISSMTAAAVSSTNIESTDSLPVMTLSSTGSLPSLSL